jgi:hypothetical protein
LEAHSSLLTFTVDDPDVIALRRCRWTVLNPIWAGRRAWLTRPAEGGLLAVLLLLIAPAHMLPLAGGDVGAPSVLHLRINPLCKPFKSNENKRNMCFDPVTDSMLVKTFLVMHYIEVQNFFSQYGPYGYQKTQHFT